MCISPHRARTCGWSPKPALRTERSRLVSHSLGPGKGEIRGQPAGAKTVNRMFVCGSVPREGSERAAGGFFVFGRGGAASKPGWRPPLQSCCAAFAPAHVRQRMYHREVTATSWS